MNELKIKRELNDETRKQAVWLRTQTGIAIYALHITDGEAIITDRHDYTKIYAVYSLDYFNAMAASKED